MDKRKELIADIVAEMRMGSPVNPGAYMIGLPDKTTVLECGDKKRTIQIKTVTVKELADRIEAAAKRKKAQNGNAAAMREALGDVYNILEKIQSFTPHLSDVSLMREFRSRVCRAKKVIDIALSAPPRNCDVGTAEEQAERYMKFCKNYPKCTGCPCVGRMQYHQCEFAWEQLPYEAEGAGK